MKAIIRLHSFKNGLFSHIPAFFFRVISKATKSIIIKLKQLLETNILLSFYYYANQIYTYLCGMYWEGHCLSHAIINLLNFTMYQNIHISMIISIAIQHYSNIILTK
jgi:hypothetical protein